MPPIELQARFEDAVLWPVVSGDVKQDNYGEVKVTTPVELKVQWVGVTGEMTDPMGNKVSTDAQVVVDREVKIGSLMWLGAYEDWLGTGSGDVDADLHKVVAFNFQKDIKGRVSRRTVGLQRYKDSLPEIT